MMEKKNRFLLLILLCTFISACSATSTSVRKVYERPGAGAFQNFLVVAVSDSSVTRRRFESAVVRAFADLDADASASNRVMAAGKPLNRDTVAAAAAETGADAVLVATLVRSETKSKIKEGQGALKTTRKDENLGDFFRYDYQEVRDPDSIDFKSKVIVATDLYEVNSGEKVWGAETTTFNKEGFEALIQSKSEAIVGQLKRDGLAR